MPRLSRAGHRFLGALICAIIGTAEADEVALLAGITVPEGFTVEVACAPPLVKHPLMADFDDRGRLYVAESAGLNLEADELLRTTPNFIRRLEDTNGDGRFDRSTIFADDMTMPMGALWHEGALYVASPPYIWRLEDTNDDGIADRREPIVGKFGFIGNAADIHGCFLGPNGRLYWCDGRHGHEFVDEQGDTRSKGQAARIFSCRTDGSDIQVHCGGGMDNPVEIDFTPAGEMLGTVNLFYQQRGDCLVHWMHGGVYPRDDQQACIAEFQRTGDLLPPVIDLGHVAVSGMTRYRGSQFGEPFADNIFITLFNTQQVVRAVLQRDGSTFRGDIEEFWKSSNPDCHPTDVLEDADGSLLIIDTGGWFRYGCPTSQIAKPEVLGAIYRVRRTDAPRVDDPRGAEIRWDDLLPKELTALLNDLRPRVRERAIAALARKGDAAVDALRKVLAEPHEQLARQNAIWALTRIETPRALAAVRIALEGESPAVRQTAAASASSTRDRHSVPHLAQMVVADDAPVRREAATALGRIGEPSAVEALLAAAANASDRVLDHAVIYALIELNDADATLAGLHASDSNVRRAALIALDQMQADPLQPPHVAAVLDTDDPQLQQAAVQIISRRDSWGTHFVEQLRGWIEAERLSAAEKNVASGALAVMIDDPAIQGLIAEVLNEPGPREPSLAVVLAALTRGRAQALPESWTPGIARLLREGSTAQRRQVLRAIEHYGEHFEQPLRQLAADDQVDAAVRQAASAALATAGLPLAEPDWQNLLSALAASTTPEQRLEIADAIGQARLDERQLSELLDCLPELSALELASVLRPYANSSHAELGARLVTVLSDIEALQGVSPSRLREVVARQPETVQQAVDALLSQRHSNWQDSAAELARLDTELIDGDAARGKQVFFGNQAACSACHAVGGQGGRIGPDLTKIGTIRTRRDLIEAIALPSSSLARGYESHAIATTEGHAYLGVVERESPEAVWIRTADRHEVRIARSEIETMELSPQSIMPEGLLNLLSPQRQADLLAYLASLGGAE